MVWISKCNSFIVYNSPFLSFSLALSRSLMSSRTNSRFVMSSSAVNFAVEPLMASCIAGSIGPPARKSHAGRRLE